MKHLEWNKVLDDYLWFGKSDPNSWEQLDDFQKMVINEIKKSIKRLKAKQNENKQL